MELGETRHFEVWIKNNSGGFKPVRSRSRKGWTGVKKYSTARMAHEAASNYKNFEWFYNATFIVVAVDIKREEYRG